MNTRNGIDPRPRTNMSRARARACERKDANTNARAHVHMRIRSWVRIRVWRRTCTLIRGRISGCHSLLQVSSTRIPSLPLTPTLTCPGTGAHDCVHVSRVSIGSGGISLIIIIMIRVIIVIYYHYYYHHWYHYYYY